MSIFWKELFRLQGTTLLHSTAYHPQTDGQSEIVNQALEGYLRCFINDQPKQWSRQLHWAEFCYNTSTHLSTNVSPFQALYRPLPPIVDRLGHNTTPVKSIDQLLREHDALLDELYAQLLIAQNRMRQAANSKRRHDVFSVGDIVFLKLQPYRQHSISRRPCDKFVARFYGPFEILAKVGAVAYKLALPSISKIHPVFHISQLKHVYITPLNFRPLIRNQNKFGRYIKIKK